MDPILELYDDVGAGKVPPPVDYNEYKRLLAKARRQVRAEDEADRRLAIDVAAAVGRDRGMDVIKMFQDDPSPAIRRHCVDRALENGEPGLMVLRKALGDADPEIVLTALTWLQRAVDRGSASQLRRLLGSEDPRIRKAAAELVGHVAGPGMSIALRPLLEDEDEGVRQAATEASRRLAGELPQDDPDPWWLIEEDTTWTPPEPLDLPDPLPDDVDGLLRVLGRARPDDEDVVLAALEAHGMSQVGRSVRTCRPNEDRDRSMGAARAGRRLGRSDWVVPLRRLLPDEDPAVRIEVARTLGEIGTSSVVMGIKQLLEAPQPQVRVAAIHALHALVDARERDRYLAPLDTDADPLVAEALAAVRAPADETAGEG